jgi:hypothetical protein
MPVLAIVLAVAVLIGETAGFVACREQQVTARRDVAAQLDRQRESLERLQLLRLRLVALELDRFDLQLELAMRQLRARRCGNEDVSAAVLQRHAPHPMP